MRDLSNLKVGDIVLMTHPYNDDRIETISRIGTSFIEVNTTKYNKHSGSIKPYSMACYGISKLATQEDIDRVNQMNRRKEVSYFFRELSYDKLSTNFIDELSNIMIKIKESTKGQ